MKKPLTIAYASLFFFISLYQGVSPARAQGSASAKQGSEMQAGPIEKDIPYYISHAPFPMPAVTAPVIPDRWFSILDYGAVGNGQTLNTAAFEKAIAACAAAGGGRLTIPAGLWLTGPIELRSNIDLHLERGALVIFTRDHTQYEPGRSGGEGHGTTGEGHASGGMAVASPIHGRDLQNIAITGEGILDGGGDSWRPVKKSKTTAAQWKELVATAGSMVSPDGEVWWPTREGAEGDRLRPYMTYLVNCRNILIEGITLRNSPKFVFYPNNCSDLTMSRVNIFNEWWAQNGDGIDISACRNVIIYRCTVSAGDDGICMKSSGGGASREAAGAGTGSAGGVAAGDKAGLENVIVAGCTVYHAHGGFVIGSNTDGGVHNIAVSDCSFIGTDVGLRFKSNMGRGGLVSGIFISNIFMRDIAGEAVLFDTYYENIPAGMVRDASRPRPKDKVPEFRDFHIRRVYCSGAKTAISITGLPEMPVSDIHFDSLVISSGRGLIATQAKKIGLSHVRLITVEKPVIQADKTAEILGVAE